MQKIVTNNVFLDKKRKTQQQQQKIIHKNPCQSQELNSETLAPCKRMCYLCTTESTLE